MGGWAVGQYRPSAGVVEGWRGPAGRGWERGGPAGAGGAAWYPPSSFPGNHHLQGDVF